MSIISFRYLNLSCILRLSQNNKYLYLSNNVNNFFDNLSYQRYDTIRYDTNKKHVDTKFNKASHLIASVTQEELSMAIRIPKIPSPIATIIP